jgi:tetratricopeptide (TPR) repeat protein
MERALALFEQLLRAKPEDADRQRNVGLCHKYLVDYFSQRDAPRALGHAQEAVRLDAARVQAVPQNVQARTDYSISLSALGDLHVVEGNETEALRLFEEALALRRELVAADTADAHARELLAYMLARVAEMHVLAGRYSQAAPLIEESLEHARGLPVRLRDRTVVFVLAKAYLLRGEVAVSAHLSPCASYREMAELLPPLPKMDDVVLFDPTPAERHFSLRSSPLLRFSFQGEFTCAMPSAGPLSRPSPRSSSRSSPRAPRPPPGAV